MNELAIATWLNLLNNNQMGIYTNYEHDDTLLMCQEQNTRHSFDMFKNSPPFLIFKTSYSGIFMNIHYVEHFTVMIWKKVIDVIVSLNKWDTWNALSNIFCQFLAKSQRIVLLLKQKYLITCKTQQWKISAITLLQACE